MVAIYVLFFFFYSTGSLIFSFIFIFFLFKSYSAAFPGGLRFRVGKHWRKRDIVYVSATPQLEFNHDRCSAVDLYTRKPRDE